MATLRVVTSWRCVHGHPPVGDQLECNTACCTVVKHSCEQLTLKGTRCSSQNIGYINFRQISCYGWLPGRVTGMFTL